MFIVLEGGEAGGKGTLASVISVAVRNSGKEIVHTRHPGGTQTGEHIREALLWGEDLTFKEEVYLFSTSHKRSFEQNILPSLKAGKVVLAERWIASTVCYQGMARHADSQVLQEHATAFINATCLELGLLDRVPDLSILLNVSPSISEERMVSRVKDRIEKKGPEFFDCVHNSMFDIHAKKPRWLMNDSLIVNANHSLMDVVTSVLDELLYREVINQDGYNVAIKAASSAKV